MQPEPHQDINIVLFTCPFDEILPWFAGCMRMGAWDDDAQKFTDRGKQYVHPPNSVVPAFVPPPINVVDFVNAPQVWRTIEIEKGDPFCIVEMSLGNHNYFSPSVDGIHRFSKCDFVTFSSYFSHSTGELFHRSFGVHRNNKPVRLVEMSRNDSGNGVRPEWSFVSEGQPQPWENSEQYEARKIGDRLTDSLLKAYMEEFGLYFDLYEKRRFSRVIDSADSPPQDGLIEVDLASYDKEAHIIRKWIVEMIEDELTALDD